MKEPLGEFRQVGRLLWEAGLVSSHGGNLSVRLGDGLLITRSGCPLGRIGQGDLVTVRADSSAAGGQPSVDTPIHRAIYEAAPAAKAIVHAHPRHAIALSLVASQIEPQDLEGRHHLGRVPVVDAQAVAAALRQHPIVVVAGHGSYARGDSLWQALQWTSVLEESAQVVWLLRGLKG